MYAQTNIFTNKYIYMYKHTYHTHTLTLCHLIRHFSLQGIKESSTLQVVIFVGAVLMSVRRGARCTAPLGVKYLVSVSVCLRAFQGASGQVLTSLANSDMPERKVGRLPVDRSVVSPSPAFSTRKESASQSLRQQDVSSSTPRGWMGNRIRGGVERGFQCLLQCEGVIAGYCPHARSCTPLVFWEGPA